MGAICGKEYSFSFCSHSSRIFHKRQLNKNMYNDHIIDTSTVFSRLDITTEFLTSFGVAGSNPGHSKGVKTFGA